MAKQETILVTGSGGFIGGWIAETLHLNSMAQVKAGVRSWSGAARLSRFPFEIVICDVMDEASISTAIVGVDRVIHCVVGARDVIVQGTENLLRVALSHNMQRFVHVSTAEVYGNSEGNVDETFPFKSTGNPYGDAKIEAEKLCWEYCQKGLPVTVIRPPIVYGPYSRDWTVGFSQRLSSGNWGVFKEYGEGFCNLIYISDLVSGILLATFSERAVGEAYNLTGPDQITWNGYFQKFDAALGLKELNEMDPTQIRIRAKILDPIRSFGKLVLKHFKVPLRKLSQGYQPAREALQFADRSLKTNPRMDELLLFSRKAKYVTDKAQNHLRFQPRFDLDKGLCLSVRWLEHAGLTPHPDATHVTDLP